MARDIASNLKVRHLSLIVALSDHGTTHRAADALHMTQSTASKMLRDVEDLFQAALFERHPRGLKPTPLGEFAISNARTQLTGLLRFADDFRARRAGGYGTLRIGAISGAGPDLVARSLADIKRKRPQLSVDAAWRNQRYRSGHGSKTNGSTLSSAGSAQNAKAKLFEFEPLAEEKLIIVARAGHALQDRKLNDLTDLVDWPWILQHPLHTDAPSAGVAFTKAGLRPPQGYHRMFLDVVDPEPCAGLRRPVAGARRLGRRPPEGRAVHRTAPAPRNPPRTIRFWSLGNANPSAKPPANSRTFCARTPCAAVM